MHLHMYNDLDTLFSNLYGLRLCSKFDVIKEEKIKNYSNIYFKMYE